MLVDFLIYPIEIHLINDIPIIITVDVNIV